MSPEGQPETARGAAGAPSPGFPSSDELWLAAAVAVSALYSLFVVVLPARGLTFLWTDWDQLNLLVVGKWPGSWLAPQDAHWMPIGQALLHAEYAAFGARHDLYLGVVWLFHVGFTALLGLLLRAWCGDGRAAALATATFGVAVTYRLPLWWAAGSFMYLATILVAFALFAIQRSHAGSRAWLAAAVAAVFLAPLVYGTGISAGPAVALEVLVLAPRPRARKLALVLGAWGLWGVLYALVRWVFYAGTVLHATANPIAVVLFLFEAVGLGFVRQVPLLPVPNVPAVGVALALVYAAVTAVVAYAVDQRGRTRILLAHALFLFFFVPVALARSGFVFGKMLNATSSQYQLFAALTWTTLLAVVLARVLGRWPRTTVFVALAAIVALGFGHAREVALDQRAYAPYARRFARTTEFVDALVAAARTARGPLYDLTLPPALSLVAVPASEAVRIVAPDVRVTWTNERTPESVAPLEAFDVLKERLDDR